MRLADPSKHTRRRAALLRGKQGSVDCRDTRVEITCANGEYLRGVLKQGLGFWAIVITCPDCGAGDALENVIVADVALVRVAREHAGVRVSAGNCHKERDEWGCFPRAI